MAINQGFIHRIWFTLAWLLITNATIQQTPQDLA